MVGGGGPVAESAQVLRKGQPVTAGWLFLVHSTNSVRTYPLVSSRNR